MTRKAVFLDRDGTLNRLVERDGIYASPRTVDEFCLLPFVTENITHLHDAGFLVFVVSNQPDIARSFLEPIELAKMTFALQKNLPIDEIMICPHDDSDECMCRKPKPGMITSLAKRWDVDLESSFMVGDSWKDIAAGKAAGCHTIYVGPLGESQGIPEITLPSLTEAVTWIISYDILF